MNIDADADAKLDFMRDLLFDSSIRFCQDYGGYPDDVARIPGFIAIASYFPCDKPELTVYTDAQVLAWYDEIIRLRDEWDEEQEGEEADIDQLLSEAEPETAYA
jgi:hypothetical protein